jgi:hypothetical protein
MKNSGSYFTNLTDLPNIDLAYIKVINSIKSVKTEDQLSSVKRLVSNFLRLYGRIGDDAASVFYKFIETKKLELNV